LWRRGTTGRSVICLDRSAIFFYKCLFFYVVWFLRCSAHIWQNNTVTKRVETNDAITLTSGSVENKLLDKVNFFNNLTEYMILFFYFEYTFNWKLICTGGGS
jgi:hypothetical protein